MVVNVVRKEFEEDIQLSFIHSLNHVLIVMAKEEEASTFAGSFTCFEQSVAVEGWTQALLEKTHAQTISFE